MKCPMSILLVVAVILGTTSPAHSVGYQILHDFAGSPGDGREPSGSLTLDAGTLYGMTWLGGGFNYGTVFSVDTDGSNFALLHAFTGGTDGANPAGNLILDSGTLYGMTSAGGGGSDNYGTIFSINTDGSGFTLLHDFAGGTSDGADPYGSLILDSGKLYGMTSNGGGSSNYGTVFSMDANGTNFALLHHFASSDGADPHGSLILDAANLYGMTYHGGVSNNFGTVFSMLKSRCRASRSLGKCR